MCGPFGWGGFMPVSPRKKATVEDECSRCVASLTLPDPSPVSFQKHEFFVDMTCEGCSNAVTRVLQKLGGVQFDIDLPNKKVCIDSEHNIDTLLETLKKTGKNASYIGEKSA
uniref:Copper transport protein ATOX1 n=1 Tax=Melopsittacus undulatus TaxID=13146 RepID=A0A8C6IPE1_MELUD